MCKLKITFLDQKQTYKHKWQLDNITFSTKQILNDFVEPFKRYDKIKTSCKITTIGYPVKRLSNKVDIIAASFIPSTQLVNDAVEMWIYLFIYHKCLCLTHSTFNHQLTIVDVLNVAIRFFPISENLLIILRFSLNSFTSEVFLHPQY